MRSVTKLNNKIFYSKLEHFLEMIHLKFIKASQKLLIETILNKV